MKFIERFVLFWYDFVVGDDWRVAVGVIAGFGVTALLVRADIAAWWLLPLVVLAMLGLTLWSAVRAAERHS